MTHDTRGYLYELFSSIQGEGLWAGRMHHFIRLAGCSLGCACCDTQAAFERGETFQINGREGGRNPVEPPRVSEWAVFLEQETPGAQAVAITGGEPLEQTAFLGALLKELKESDLKGLPVLLETGGLHPHAMEELRDQVDLVSMDIKLPSTSRITNSLPGHERFLKALGGTSFYLKAVVNDETSLKELEEAVSMVAAAAPEATLFLQPETRDGSPRSGAYLLSLWEEARKRMDDVRILPQVHPLLALK